MKSAVLWFFRSVGFQILSYLIMVVAAGLLVCFPMTSKFGAPTSSYLVTPTIYLAVFLGFRWLRRL